MEAGPLIIILIRLIVPFSIFRFPFWGTMASFFIDFIDIGLMNAMGLGGFSDYPRVDKALDSYYLLFAFITSFKWKSLAKRTSIVLFAYRMIGVLAFEITGTELFLLFFPNLFEGWFLFWAARNRYFPGFKLTLKKLIIILVILFFPKIIQEFILHYPLPGLWAWIHENLGFAV